jgi:uncharacterized protein
VRRAPLIAALCVLAWQTLSTSTHAGIFAPGSDSAARAAPTQAREDATPPQSASQTQQPVENTGPATELGAPRAYVTDEAGVLDAEMKERLEHYLTRVDRELGAQFAVVTIATTGDQAIEDYAADLYKRWGIGGQKSDEGLLLLVAVNDRHVRFEVGYGLEGALPDALVGQIILKEIRPRFRQGDFGGGILAGVVAAARVVARDKGVAAPEPGEIPTPQRATRNSPIGFVQLLIPLAVILLFSFIASHNRRRRRRGRRSFWDNFWDGTWSGGSGGSGGFGGFGGFGGGSSGGGFGGFGGGSSGGGFAGFGGGSSGGGGASGSW